MPKDFNYTGYNNELQANSRTLRKRMTPEEKRRAKKYRFLLCVYIVLNLVFFLTFDWLAAFLVSSFSKTEYLYIYFGVTVPFVLFTIFFLLSFLFAIQLFEGVGKGVSSFTDFISQKKHKNLIRIICLLITSFCTLISFVCVTQTRVITDETGAVETFLFKKDETLFNYNSADRVKVYVETEYGLNLHTTTTHHVYVAVADDNETYVFYSEGFDRDHKRILDFLENFDKKIITVDPTDKEMVLTTSDEQQYFLEQIFDKYS